MLSRKWKHVIIALMSLAAIAGHLLLRYAFHLDQRVCQIPLWIALSVGGIPLILELTSKLLRLRFGSDLLAGISIVTAALLGQYLAGTIIVLMLSGGSALEIFAVARASSVLRALAQRMPSLAHRRHGSQMIDVVVEEVQVGDILVVFPHDICPVDGTVIEGNGSMDESFLTGEPFRMSKAPGSEVISGAINGEAVLTIEAKRRAADSRYTKIMEVMRESEMNRPRLRRLGDQLGAFYTPLALLIAITAWVLGGNSTRFLAVLVVATPCPLLIGIPVAIIGAISLAARRGIIVKDPVVLEQIDTCRTVIFDKTGTLTYGKPELTEQIVASGVDATELFELVASLERYSKHPLSQAVLDAAPDLQLRQATEVSEPPGHGLFGVVDGHAIQITSRSKAIAQKVRKLAELPATAGGLECVIIVDGAYAGTYRFRDAPRRESASFIQHLKPRHRFARTLIVSGDRESEVRYLADQVGISDIAGQRSPEEKVAIVRDETSRARTLFVGDGINDAPALLAATVGIAIGQNSDVTTEAAGAVVMDSSLERVDEFLHISRRMRRIALQTAIGGMTLSMVGMICASAGLLDPIAGALAQEAIDILAVLNALRTGFPPKQLSDFASPPSMPHTAFGRRHPSLQTMQRGDDRHSAVFPPALSQAHRTSAICDSREELTSKV